MSTTHQPLISIFKFLIASQAQLDQSTEVSALGKLDSVKGIHVNLEEASHCPTFAKMSLRAAGSDKARTVSG